LPNLKNYDLFFKQTENKEFKYNKLIKISLSKITEEIQCAKIHCQTLPFWTLKKLNINKIIDNFANLKVRKVKFCWLVLIFLI
jgi:hypothetical protein